MPRPPLLPAALLLLALAAPAPAQVADFRVTTDRTVDSSSLESIVRDAVAQSGAKTDDQKCVAIYEYLHHAIFHRAYPAEPRPQTVGPLKVLNVYGWSLCGGQHTVLKALYETAGYEVRYVGWPGHTTVEVKYGGRWHYFDVFLKCYYWSKDGTHVVSQEEIAADPSIVLDAPKQGRAARENLCCGDAPEDVVAGCKARQVVGDSKGWASVTWRDEGYSPKLALPVGATLKLDWAGEAKGHAAEGYEPTHSCGNKDFRSDAALGPIAEHYGTRGWSNGHFTYAPDFANPATLAGVELTGAAAKNGKLAAAAGQGVALFKLPSPYPFMAAELTGTFTGPGGWSASVDGGKTWSKCDAGDLSKLVRQRYGLWLTAEFAGSLDKLKLTATVEHNRGVLPQLMPGKNRVSVAFDGSSLPKGATTRVTYSYREATAPPKRTRFDGKGVAYGPVKTATKDFATPGTFEVEVGGNTPPKMLSLERAVVVRE